MDMKKKTILLLFIFNVILLILSWVMAFYAYPKLPQRIPLWLNFLGQQTIKVKKTPLFFIYPLAQNLLYLSFYFVSRNKHLQKRALKRANVYSTKARKSHISDLKEFVYLCLIFFNLIFIHIQRSLILMAHGIEKGVDLWYFFSLFGIILILIPYYRIRKKKLIEK